MTQSTSPIGFPLAAPTPSGSTATPTCVEYELTPKEVADSMMHQATHQPALWRATRRARRQTLAGLFLALLVCCVLISRIEEPASADPDWLWIAAAVATGYWLFIAGVIVLSTRSRIAKEVSPQRRMYDALAADPAYKRLYGRYRLEIDTEGFIEHSAGKELRVKWAAVQEIFADVQAGYFSLGPSGYVIFPPRAFGDIDAYWRFVRLARQYHSQSGSDWTD